MTALVTAGVTLLVKFGSPTGGPTLATFVSVPTTGAVTVKVTLVTWLETSVPTFQVTTLALVAQLPLALTNVAPAGTASVTTTPVAALGPKLVTLMV